MLVNLFMPIQGRKKIKGVIDKVEGEIITLKEADEVYAVPFSAMSKARMVPEFNL